MSHGTPLVQSALYDKKVGLVLQGGGAPGQPEELASAYVLLASSDGSFMTGALIEFTGGRLSAA